MWQRWGGRIGFFDGGTSDQNSLSLWFPAKSPGTPVLHGAQAREQYSEGRLLPKHRSWSGGLLCTLPGAEFSVPPFGPRNLPRQRGRSIVDKTDKTPLSQNSRGGFTPTTGTA